MRLLVVGIACCFAIGCQSMMRQHSAKIPFTESSTVVQNPVKQANHGEKKLVQGTLLAVENSNNKNKTAMATAITSSQTLTPAPVAQSPLVQTQALTLSESSAPLHSPTSAPAPIQIQSHIPAQSTNGTTTTTGLSLRPIANHRALKAEQSGIANVIRSVPEPQMTWREEKGTTRFQSGRRGVTGPVVSGLAQIPPRGEVDAGEFAATVPQGTEQGIERSPIADVANQQPAVAIQPNSGPFRTITESNVRRLAAERSPAAHRYTLENLIPSPAYDDEYQRRKFNNCLPIFVSHTESSSSNANQIADRFLRQARELAAQGERIKAVDQATTTFYQLAEYEGQSELLRAGVAAFDKMRGELDKPIMIQGRQVKIPAEKLVLANRQRADLLYSAERLDFACNDANIQLKSQIGVVGNSSDRLYPMGDFGIDPNEIDVEATVQTALENRPDLQLLRLAYFELNEETLPAIREQLKASIGLMNMQRGFIAARHFGILRTALDRFGKKQEFDPLLIHELAVRKAQLFDLICEKEREAADQVRRAANAQKHAASIVGMLRWKSESVKKEIDKLQAARQPAEALLLDWYKARAEVISAVMNWHQARCKLSTAQGKVSMTE